MTTEEVEDLADELYNMWGNVRMSVVDALGESGLPAAVPGLIKAFAEGGGNVRKRAGHWLKRMESVEAVSGLIGLFASYNDDVREHAALLTGMMGGIAVPLLAEAIRGTDPRVNQLAARVLVGRGSSAVPALVGNLNFWRDGVRLQSINILIKVGDERAVGPLIEKLKDNNADVRELAHEALLKLGKLAVPELLQVLTGDDPDLREMGAKLLRLIGDERALPMFKGLLKDPDVRIRCEAVQAVGVMGGSTELNDLETALADEAAQVRLEAIKGFISMDLNVTVSVTDYLIKGLADKDNRVVAAALKGLRKLRASVDVSSVSGLLRSDAEEDRIEVVRMLADMGNRDALEPLLAALRDESVKVRLEAVAALGVIGDRRAAQPLLDAISGEWGIKKAGTIALARLGDARALDGMTELVYMKEPGAELILKNMEKFMPREDKDFLCSNCLHRAVKFAVKSDVWLFKNLFNAYYACRKCRSNLFLLDAVTRVVLVLSRSFNQSGTKMYERSGSLVRVDGGASLVDFDEVRIENVGDYELEKFCMQVKNDMDPVRSKRLREIPVFMAPNLNLGQAKLNLLQATFKSINTGELQ